MPRNFFELKSRGGGSIPMLPPPSVPHRSAPVDMTRNDGTHHVCITQVSLFVE